MNYLYEAIKPTRLYIKQCPHCNLKYFGKTTSENIEAYPGSGSYWIKHIKMHDVEPTHLWNSDWYYDTSISRFAIKFSRLNKIVDSKVWANLKEENGLEGGFDHLNDGSEEHIERTRKGGLASINNTAAQVNRIEAIRRAHKEGKCTYDGMKGKTHSIKTKKLMSKAHEGAKNSQFGKSWIWHEKFGNKKVKKELVPNYIDQGWIKTYKPGYKIT